MVLWFLSAIWGSWHSRGLYSTYLYKVILLWVIICIHGSSFLHFKVFYLAHNPKVQLEMFVFNLYSILFSRRKYLVWIGFMLTEWITRSISFCIKTFNHICWFFVTCQSKGLWQSAMWRTTGFRDVPYRETTTLQNMRWLFLDERYVVATDYPIHRSNLSLLSDCTSKVTD